MSSIALYDREEIERYLRSLRQAQRRSWIHGDGNIVERSLTAHRITVEPGATDYYHGADTPLQAWLSFLDDDSRRARVSLVCIELADVGRDERELLARVAADASIP